MNKQTHTIAFKDKVTVNLDVFTSTRDIQGPIILILPAMGVKASYYEPFIQELVANNITTMSVDLRGLGTYSIRPSKKIDFGYLDMITDLKVVVDTIKSKYSNLKIYGLGHSLGGQIMALAQAKYTHLFSGLILAAANSVYYKTWSGKQRYFNRIGYSVFPLLSRLLGYFPGHKVGFGGKAAKTQLIDWAYVGRTGQYNIIGDDLDYEKALKNVAIPVLAVYIEGDWLSPKAAMAHLYGKFSPTAPITNYTLTRAATGVKLNHFNWVKNGRGIVETIGKWLKGTMKKYK